MKKQQTSALELEGCRTELLTNSKNSKSQAEFSKQEDLRRRTLAKREMDLK